MSGYNRACSAQKCPAIHWPFLSFVGDGRAAVAHLEEKAREMGVNAVHLEVDHGNDAAHELYRRGGYESHDRFLMTKWLTGGGG